MARFSSFFIALTLAACQLAVHAAPLNSRVVNDDVSLELSKPANGVEYFYTSVKSGLTTRSKGKGGKGGKGGGEGEGEEGPEAPEAPETDVGTAVITPRSKGKDGGKGGGKGGKGGGEGEGDEGAEAPETDAGT
ncbi:hypothetical protein H0H81_002245, partial [Sphagnurus paluster]